MTFIPYNNHTFTGNNDWNTIAYNDINPAIIARFIRVHPVKGNNIYGKEYVGLKLELYECKDYKGNVKYFYYIN